MKIMLNLLKHQVNHLSDLSWSLSSNGQIGSQKTKKLINCIRSCATKVQYSQMSFCMLKIKESNNNQIIQKNKVIMKDNQIIMKNKVFTKNRLIMINKLFMKIKVIMKNRVIMKSIVYQINKVIMKYYIVKIRKK